MVNIYDWGMVKSAVSCKRYLEDQGVQVSSQGRCAAPWRGGVSKDSVHVDDEKGLWHDFVKGEGGTVIDLCAAIECNGDRLVALRTLGDRYHVTPKSTAKKAKRTRGEVLVAEGYSLVKTYTYTDADGNDLYFVDRYEHPEKGKEFVQRTKDADNIQGVERVLYNLPAVVKSQEVFIVEGEKDVETLRSLNFVATTNSGGGANKWDVKNNGVFSGKDVVIIADNDETGEKHGKNVYSMLLPIAKSVKLLTISNLPKGDVTDWMEKEGGSAQKLREIVDAHKSAVCADSPDVAMAKQLNETPFSNYVGEGKDASAKTINDLVEEVHNRFLGFPRIIGEQLFDWDKHRNVVNNIVNKHELFAWIQGTSKQPVHWSGGEGYVSRDELFCRLLQSSVRYSGISSAPHYPMRTDVFYTYGKLPPPDPTHSTFWEFVNFFNPATPANKTLIAAFFLAPMYSDTENRAPMFIIDTDDAQASGKTTLVEIAAKLYGDTPIMLDFGQLERDQNQVIRRILSTSARQKRIALFDNLTSTIKSEKLAVLVTQSTISGMAPYGRKEETRPNDLIFVATMNGASIDTDTASRSYTIRLKAPKTLYKEWRKNVVNFIETNRKQLYSDMIHMMQNAKNRDRHCRFGVFDQMVVSAVCRTDEEFDAVDASIKTEAERANEDADRGAEFVELILSRVASEVDNFDLNRPFVMRNTDINYYLSHSSGSLKMCKVQYIRQLVKQGQIKTVSKFFDRMPQTDGIGRPHAMLFGMEHIIADSEFSDAQVVVYDQSKKHLVLLDNILLKTKSVMKPESAMQIEVEES